MLEGRKAEMAQMMNRHVCDEVPENETVRKKLIRGKWLNNDRGEKTREHLVAMEIAASGGNETTIMRRPPERQLDRKPQQRVLGIDDNRDAFFHVPMNEEIYVRMPRWVCKKKHVGLWRRALYGTRQASKLWQKTVDRALKELDFGHLVVVPCTYSHEAWDMALTRHGAFLSESESEHQDLLEEGLAGYSDVKCTGRTGPGFQAQDDTSKSVVENRRNSRVKAIRRNWSSSLG